MKWIKFAIRGIEYFNENTAKIVSWLILVIMPITLYDVVMRYFFDAPTIWAYGLSGLLLGPFWLLAGGYVLLQDAHVRMDVFYRRLSPRRQAILDLATYTLFFFYCALILKYGINYFGLSFTRQSHARGIWKPVLWPFDLFIPAGAAFILLAGVAKYIRDLYLAITGRPLR